MYIIYDRVMHLVIRIVTKFSSINLIVCLYNPTVYLVSEMLFQHLFTRDISSTWRYTNYDYVID